VTAAEPSADACALPRYVITGGGEPSPEELAALTVALTPVVTDGPASGADAPPAWVRAALMENVGRRPLVSADDLGAATPLFT
jgi:hypothetical protein